MPYPNEHSCRLEDPAKYDRFARKNCEEKSDGKCIDVIYGIKENKSEIQALRYPKDTWEEKDAKDHCKSRGGTFEPAEKEKAMAQEKEKYECECVKCGHKMESEKHCKDIKCPKCGGDMRRVERPGPGSISKKEEKVAMGNEIVTKQSFAVAYPDLFKEIDKEAFDRGVLEGKTQGRIEGAETEKKRIKDVEGQLIAGHEATIQELKYDGKTTGPEAAVIVLKKENELRSQRLKDLREDGKKVVVPDATPPDVEAGDKGDDEKRKILIEEYKKANPKASDREAVVAVSKQHAELFKNR